jgi:glycosyltransferase involved in cell wall biosynthesis
LNKSKKVLFIRGARHASGYYRMQLPCQELQRLGYTTDIINHFTIDPQTMTGVKEVEDKLIPYDLTKSDIVIFQMVYYEALLLVIDNLKNKGIFTVMEIDDDYLHLPASNPAFNSFHPKMRLEKDQDDKPIYRLYPYKVNFALDNLFKAMARVDLIQTSTPELAEVYERYNKVVVLPNYIDNSLYDSVPKVKNDKVVVGWFGTKTHIEDLRIVNGCIPSTARLLIAGFPEVIDVGLFKDLKDTILIPPYKPEQHTTELPKIIKQCDIGIAPLVECRFNECKSELKAIEFNAAGIPVIATDIAPYHRYVVHGENGFLVPKNKTKFWLRYLKMLVEDKDLRTQMSIKAKEKAREKDIRLNINKWVDTYFK